MGETVLIVRRCAIYASVDGLVNGVEHIVDKLIRTVYV
jgi:hypothetical protein